MFLSKGEYKTFAKIRIIQSPVFISMKWFWDNSLNTSVIHLEACHVLPCNSFPLYHEKNRCGITTCEGMKKGNAFWCLLPIEYKLSFILKKNNIPTTTKKLSKHLEVDTNLVRGKLPIRIMDPHLCLLYELRKAVFPSSKACIKWSMILESASSCVHLCIGFEW